jgi:L-alanine-DL-glutamate epimerase-like enolase superfamily enzyme
MRIERVRAGHVAVPMAQPMRTAIHTTTETHNALVQIEADGVAGQGMALTLAAGQARAVCAMIEDLAPLILERDAREPRPLWEDLRVRLNLTGHSGVGLLALTALDTAVWDLHARAAGLPLFRLLGGSSRPMPVYAQPGWLSLSKEELVEEALGLQSQGFRYYKMRVGSAHWREDIARVEAVRAALDPGTELMVDANQGWNRVQAGVATRALDDLGLFWIEEPLSVDDVTGTAQLAAALRTPIAAGETVFGAEGLQPLIEQQAASVLMPDLQHCGGPTGFLRAAAAADLASVPLSNHLFLEASVPLLAACRNVLVVEHMPGWWDELFEEPPAIEKGMVTPREAPGIGVRFREDLTSTLRTVGIR